MCPPCPPTDRSRTAIRRAGRRRSPGAPAPARRSSRPHARSDRGSADVGCLAHEEAQPHGRGEEALLRGPAVFGGVVAEPRPFRHLGLVVHVRVATLLDRRAAGDEKPGEVPVGRPLPASQPLIRQRMTGPRTDEVEPERASDRFAHFGGFGRAGHVTSTGEQSPRRCRHRLPLPPFGPPFLRWGIGAGRSGSRTTTCRSGRITA